MARNKTFGSQYKFQYQYAVTPEAGLVISESGYSFKLVPDVATALIVPFFNRKTSYAMLLPGLKNGDMAYIIRTRSLIGNFALFTFANIENTSVDCTIYLMTTGIGDLEPNVTINFAGYQTYIDRYKQFMFDVRNAKWISY